LNVQVVPSAVLRVSPTALNFSAVAGGAAPAAQTVSVVADFTTNGSAVVTKQSCGLSNWLSISPTGSFTAGTDPTTFSVSTDPTGLTAGTTCNGSVLITAASGVRTVPITLTVTTPSVSSLAVTPSNLLFTAPAGRTAPASQFLSVVAPASISATIQLSEQSCADSAWLSVSPGASFTPGPAGTTIAVSVDQSGLLAGSLCRGTLTITWASGTQTVSVMMFVTTSSGDAAVSATPTAVTINYSVGDPNPPAQVIALSGSGGAVTFTISASSSPWMKVSASCSATAPCTTPNNGTFNFVITADPTGLDAGTYYGVVFVAGTGQTTGTTTINVAFTVSAPVPVITLVTNGASFLTGPVAPGEMIAIFGNVSAPIGPATAAKLDDSTCPTPCTNAPTSLGGVQVVFQPGGIAAPLVFVSSTQIACTVPYEVLGNSSGKVEVRYLGQRSAAVPVQYVPTQPGIYTALGTGSGLAAVQQYDADGNSRGQNSANNPAEPGWSMVFYVTGEGMIPAPAVTGKITTAGPLLPLLGPPTVVMDNLPAKISYFSEAQGQVAGMMQVNAVVPTGVHSGQIPLSLSLNGNSSQPGVFIFIK